MLSLADGSQQCGTRETATVRTRCSCPACRSECTSAGHAAQCRLFARPLAPGPREISDICLSVHCRSFGIRAATHCHECKLSTGRSTVDQALLSRTDPKLAKS